MTFLDAAHERGLHWLQLSFRAANQHERERVIYFSQPCVNMYIRRDRDKIHAGKKGRIHRNSGITDRPAKAGIHSRATRPQRERDAL